MKSEYTLYTTKALTSVRDSLLLKLQLVIKQALDFSWAFIALLMLLPLFFLIALLIKFDSSGPVFYGQVRLGKDEKPFRIWKFRSMRQDAEAKSGPIWADACDNRSTRIGSTLRRLNLDELPQLFNVVIGDMSLVGPRPERPIFVEKFKQEITAYHLRHRVKPGITGFAQINGWRGKTSLLERIKHDNYYIDNYSLWFDFKIIIKTIINEFLLKIIHF